MTYVIGTRCAYQEDGATIPATVRGVLTDGRLRVIGDGLNVCRDLPAHALAPLTAQAPALAHTPAPAPQAAPEYPADSLFGGLA